MNSTASSSSSSSSSGNEIPYTLLKYTLLSCKSVLSKATETCTQWSYLGFCPLAAVGGTITGVYDIVQWRKAYKRGISSEEFIGRRQMIGRNLVSGSISSGIAGFMFISWVLMNPLLSLSKYWRWMLLQVQGNISSLLCYGISYPKYFQALQTRNRVVRAKDPSRVSAKKSSLTAL